jgi:hypothetical protein
LWLILRAALVIRDVLQRCDTSNLLAPDGKLHLDRQHPKMVAIVERRDLDRRSGTPGRPASSWSMTDVRVPSHACHQYGAVELNPSLQAIIQFDLNAQAAGRPGNTRA